MQPLTVTAMVLPMALVTALRGASLEVSRGVSLGASMGLSRAPSMDRGVSLGVSNQQVSAGTNCKQTAPVSGQIAVLMIEFQSQALFSYGKALCLQTFL